MNKTLKQIYYSEELPKLNFWICPGLCALISTMGDKKGEFKKYYLDFNMSNPERDSNYLDGYKDKGVWCDDRLNLICLLIHSLELED